MLELQCVWVNVPMVQRGIPTCMQSSLSIFLSSSSSSPRPNERGRDGERECACVCVVLPPADVPAFGADPSRSCTCISGLLTRMEQPVKYIPTATAFPPPRLQAITQFMLLSPVRHAREDSDNLLHKLVRHSSRCWNAPATATLPCIAVFHVVLRPEHYY